MGIKPGRIFATVIISLVIGSSFTNRTASADHLPPIFSVIPFLWPQAPGIPQHGNINIGGDGSFGGRVGIGTTTPGEKLEVAGHIKITGDFMPLSTSSGALMWLDETHRIEMYSNGVDGMNYFDLVNFAGDLSSDLYAWRFRDTTGNTLMQINTKGGNVGIGTEAPIHPLEMASGAHVTSGGVWTDASSRDYKENIVELDYDNAITTLKNLTPVTYNYKVDKDENHVGFIAEDVPDLVATSDRKSLSPMDITAVLTKVVKNQQEEILQLKAENAMLKESLAALAERQKTIEEMLLAIPSNVPGQNDQWSYLYPINFCR